VAFNSIAVNVASTLGSIVSEEHLDSPDDSYFKAHQMSDFGSPYCCQSIRKGKCYRNNYMCEECLNVGKYYCSYFTDEKTETERDIKVCSKFLRQ
jgi:hypothetical protein